MRTSENTSLVGNPANRANPHPYYWVRALRTCERDITLALCFREEV